MSYTNYKKVLRQIDTAIKEANISFDAQGSEIDSMVDMERRIQNDINNLPDSVRIYSKFIEYITENLNNILRAKPFYRIKEKDFNSGVSAIFKKRSYGKEDVESLMKYPGNYQLLSFLMKYVTDKGINKDFEEYCKLRDRIIKSNLALAINRSIRFSNKTSSSTASINSIDLLNLSCIGLVNAVDKYVGKYKTNFRSVCIGQMTRAMIEANSNSLAKVPSGDKKLLYRINILKFRKGITDLAKITEIINERYKLEKEQGKIVPKLPISQQKISQLMGSVDSQSDSTNSEDGSDHLSASDDGSISSIEERQAMSEISKRLKDLHILERKVIKLKGVDL